MVSSILNTGKHKTVAQSSEPEPTNVQKNFWTPPISPVEAGFPFPEGRPLAVQRGRVKCH